MNLYHIDSVTGPEEIHVWAPSYDEAYMAALRSDIFQDVAIGDIRLRRMLRNTEILKYSPCPKGLRLSTAVRI